MATIPSNQKFHTVPDGVDTVDKGSAQSAADRKVYTMQDIQDTVTAGGGVDGNGQANYLPIWEDANTLTDSPMYIETPGEYNVKVTEHLSARQLNLYSSLNTAPSSATDTGVLGEIRWAEDYVYLCISTNTWVRAALATW